MKIKPLTSVKNLGLGGLHISNSRIPINPLKLVRVSMENSLFKKKEKLNPDFKLKGIKNQLAFTLWPQQAPLSKLMKRREELEEEPPEKEELDWWSKYYTSLEEIERKVRLHLDLNKCVGR